jgi:hypothetical protein
MTSLSRSCRVALLPLMFAALLVAGCAKETVRYGDAKGVETVTTGFGSTDLQVIAESMTRSLLGSSVVTNANRPVMTVQEVKNKTSEYIDTRAITDSIRTELQKSGRVRFAVDAAAMQQQVDELKRQQSELYEKDKTVPLGKMVGAAYRLEGNITSIVKQAGDTRDVWYKFNLQLWNIENGLMEWGDEKEIRKTATK